MQIKSNQDSLLCDGFSFCCMILLILLMCLSHFNAFVFRDPGCCKAEPDTAPDSPALSVQFQRDPSGLSQSMSQECRPEMGLLRPGRTAYMYILYSVYIYIVTYVYIYIYVSIYIYVCVYIYICIYIYMYVYIYIYLFIYFVYSPYPAYPYSGRCFASHC